MSLSGSIPSQDELRKAFNAINGEQIPSIPDVLMGLYHELENREPKTARIIDLVAKDQAITGQVLKTVNSPAFGLSQPVDSINQAVVLLGFKQLKNIITAAAFESRFQAKSPVSRQVWQDSLTMAQVAAQIAYHVQDVSQDEAYLTVLLHNCGALLMAEKYSIYEKFIALEKAHPLTLIDKENQYFGTNHAVIGYLFAVYWKLPEKSCQAIYLHHALRCDGLDDPKLRALIAVLKVAYLLVLEKYLPTDAFSLERIQYLAYAKKELMLNNELIDELRTEVILGQD